MAFFSRLKFICLAKYVKGLVLIFVYSIYMTQELSMNFQIFPGYKIWTIPNTSVQMLSNYPNKRTEAECVNLCSEFICTAIVYSLFFKSCSLNRYGRVTLGKETNFSTWVKSMPLKKFAQICSFHL